MINNNLKLRYNIIVIKVIILMAEMAKHNQGWHSPLTQTHCHRMAVNSSAVHSSLAKATWRIRIWLQSRLRLTLALYPSWITRAEARHQESACTFEDPGNHRETSCVEARTKDRVDRQSERAHSAESRGHEAVTDGSGRIGKSHSACCFYLRIGAAKQSNLELGPEIRRKSVSKSWSPKTR